MQKKTTKIHTEGIGRLSQLVLTLYFTVFDILISSDKINDAGLSGSTYYFFEMLL